MTKVLTVKNEVERVVRLLEIDQRRRETNFTGVARDGDDWVCWARGNICGWAPTRERAWALVREQPTPKHLDYVEE